MDYIDINCDVGEGVGNEAQLFPLISSCNIACGGHAGNVSSIKRIVGLAKKWNIKIGAHPSYPDKKNFGRTSMNIPSEALIKSIEEQIDRLFSIVQKQNIPLHHIKAHGALYNDIAANAALASTFLKAISKFGKDILIFVPFGSEIEKMAITQGYSIRHEAFADRNYNADLSLVKRSHPEALIQSPELVLKHVVQIVKFQKVRTLTTENVRILADTFCIHSDTPAAIKIVMYLSQELPNHNIRIKK